MTDQERKIIKMTADLWNEFMALPVCHPMDREETARDIHNIQNRVYARKAIREERANG